MWCASKAYKIIAEKVNDLQEITVWYYIMVAISVIDTHNWGLFENVLEGNYSMILHWGCHIRDWYTQLGSFLRMPCKRLEYDTTSRLPHLCSTHTIRLCMRMPCKELQYDIKSCVPLCDFFVGPKPKGPFFSSSSSFLFFFPINVFHENWKLLKSFFKKREKKKTNVVKYESFKQHVCMWKAETGFCLFVVVCVYVYVFVCLFVYLFWGLPFIMYFNCTSYA